MSHHHSALDTPVDGPRPQLWRNRDFLLLLSGQAVSSAGAQISSLAFPVLLLALTGSPAQTGAMTALRILPYLLFGLPAGALIDRWDRKRVMLLCDLGRAVVLGSIPLALALGQLTLVQIYVVSLIEGTLFIFFNLAEAACLPRVVPKAQLGAATARFQMADALAGVIGPSLFGVLYTLGGASLPFLTDAVSYAVSVCSLLLIKVPFQGERVVALGSLRAEMREGVVWLWNHSLLRFLTVLIGGLNLCVAGYALILIVIAQRLGASEVEIGVMFASGGVGAIAGSFLLGPLQRRWAFRPLLIGATWIWALTWLNYIVAPNMLVLDSAVALSMVIVPIHTTVQYSYRLGEIPDRLQGRVNGAFRLVLFTSQTIGLVLTGFLLEAIGPVATVLVLFVPQLVLAIIATFRV